MGKRDLIPLNFQVPSFQLFKRERDTFSIPISGSDIHGLATATAHTKGAQRSGKFLDLLIKVASLLGKESLLSAAAADSVKAKEGSCKAIIANIRIKPPLADCTYSFVQRGNNAGSYRLSGVPRKEFTT